jgi:hypothetical protein
MLALLARTGAACAPDVRATRGRGLSAVGPAAGTDGEDVDDALRIAASEDHPPFSDPQSPQPIRATQPPDVALGEHSDRRLDALAVAATEASQ